MKRRKTRSKRKEEEKSKGGEWVEDEKGGKRRIRWKGGGRDYEK